jgi:hypothetical protein
MTPVTELKTVDISNIQTGLRNFTKWAIGVIVGLAGLMQIDAVKNFVTPILAQHPKISSIVLGLVAVGLLLQNPAVQRILHLDITGTTVKISDGSGNQLVETKLTQPTTAAAVTAAAVTAAEVPMSSAYPLPLAAPATIAPTPVSAPAPAPVPTASIRLSI